MVNAGERALTAKIEQRYRGTTPGLHLQVFCKGEKRFDITAGETYALYDLASLTKIMFAVPAAMIAFERGFWRVGSRVNAYWPSFPRMNVTIEQLLTHSSGALWWHPFFEEMPNELPSPRKRAWLRKRLETLPWDVAGQSVYSDVGMMALGFCLEAMFQKPLPDIWDNVKRLIGGDRWDVDFHEGNKPRQRRDLYAPTEWCARRGHLLQGEVHDDNAWAFGGISTHAGLFGSIDAVSAYGLFLRGCLLGTCPCGIASEVVKRFTARAIPQEQGDWALGFMMPGATASSAGPCFSQRSVGHTGFTGTSLWFDPDADVLVVLLSNRVFLGRDNSSFKTLRPLIHTWAVEALALN